MSERLDKAKGALEAAQEAHYGVHRTELIEIAQAQALIHIAESLNRLLAQSPPR